MVIDLRKCAEKPLEVCQMFNLVDRFASHPQVETLSPVTAELRVSPVGPGRFLVRGRLSAELTAYCGRCLEVFPVAAAREIALTYLPADDRPSRAAGEGEMPLDEVDISYYEDHRLEILPLLEEQLNLAFPMRFLCSETCRGLCPQCGANRNRAACDGHGPGADSRLEVLKSLLH